MCLLRNRNSSQALKVRLLFFGFVLLRLGGVLTVFHICSSWPGPQSVESAGMLLVTFRLFGGLQTVVVPKSTGGKEMHSQCPRTAFSLTSTGLLLMVSEATPG